MTSQDALIRYFVETSGVTSPKLIAEMLGVPSETARKWMQRYRKVRSDSTGQIRPVVDIDRSNPTKPVKSDRSDQPALARAQAISKNNKTPPLSPPPKTWAQELNPAQFEKVTWSDDGLVQIVDEVERADWLAKFETQENLDLALMQISQYVQPNSRKPLLTQVRAQLARQVRERNDKDARYQKAAQQNGKKTGKNGYVYSNPLVDNPRNDVTSYAD